MVGKRVPVAVIGAGNMGKNHVRVYNELPEAELVEVVEPDPDKAEGIADSFDVSVYEDITQIELAEAATIAVPSPLHRDVATQCLRAGLDLLVEKPLANTPAAAREIIDAAEEMDAVLQVGHIERFNPATRTLADILKQQEIHAIETHRLGPFNEHLADEHVVFDLMIHDLDIVTHLVPGDLRQYNVVGSRVKSSDCDHAIVQLKFESGTIGTLTASHITNGKVRTLDVTTGDTYINMDYQQQDITIQRSGSRQTAMVSETSGYKTQIITETPFVESREPLRNELEHFVSSVRTGSEPDVSGEEGYEAVRLCADIASAICERYPETN